MSRTFRTPRRFAGQAFLERWDVEHQLLYRVITASSMKQPEKEYCQNCLLDLNKQAQHLRRSMVKGRAGIIPFPVCENPAGLKQRQETDTETQAPKTA